ncbi:MAG: hypothetical protein P4L79_18285 [Legionella sp.]|uniref:hypothetical protein n=1 Tax=Legionella sp. TaxID=459 RepID=UPI00283C9DD9|nr:hypothetical protein [Legionella sp.]
MRITIKLDPNKIRIYLTGNTDSVDALVTYLSSQDYKDVHAVLADQPNGAAGYSLKTYSMAYSKSNHNLLVEGWFPIQKHFTDSSFSTDINNLIKHLNLPVAEGFIFPNATLSSLRSRKYVTVFDRDDVSLGDSQTLIQQFELMIQSIRIQAHLEEKIPSEVVPSAAPMKSAIHAKGLTIFGLLNMPSAPVSEPFSADSASISQPSTSTQRG